VRTIGDDRFQVGAGEPQVLAEQAADLLGVKPSWLRRKAAARAVPCTFVGKHLRFSDHDVTAIVQAGQRQPASGPLRRMRPHPS
jgi:excisionase family DNA binding protein